MAGAGLTILVGVVVIAQLTRGRALERLGILR